MPTPLSISGSYSIRKTEKVFYGERITCPKIRSWYQSPQSIQRSKNGLLHLESDIENKSVQQIYNACSDQKDFVADDSDCGSHCGNGLHNHDIVTVPIILDSECNSNQQYRLSDGLDRWDFNSNKILSAYDASENGSQNEYFRTKQIILDSTCDSCTEKIDFGHEMNDFLSVSDNSTFVNVNDIESTRRIDEQPSSDVELINQKSNYHIVTDEVSTLSLYSCSLTTYSVVHSVEGKIS
jgi:hypothetical protein